MRHSRSAWQAGRIASKSGAGTTPLTPHIQASSFASRSSQRGVLNTTPSYWREAASMGGCCNVDLRNLISARLRSWAGSRVGWMESREHVMLADIAVAGPTTAPFDSTRLPTSILFGVEEGCTVGTGSHQYNTCGRAHAALLPSGKARARLCVGPDPITAHARHPAPATRPRFNRAHTRGHASPTHLPKEAAFPSRGPCALIPPLPLPPPSLLPMPFPA